MIDAQYCEQFTDDELDVAWLRNGLVRLVKNPKRRRKLQKRGVFLWWSSALQGWLWDPKGMMP